MIMYKSEKLVQHIKQLIENGSYSANTKLPSLRAQAQVTGYSLMTILNAYQTLIAEGRVYSKEKSGFFISEYNYNTYQKTNTVETSQPQKIKINSKVFSYLKQTQASDYIYFSSAFPDEQCLYNTKIMKILAHYAQQKPIGTTNKNMPPGNLKLRQQIANRYILQGIPTQADDIIITSGALDALNLALQTLTQTGDYILLQDTIFYGAWQAAERLGLQVITLPTHPQYGFNLQAFEDLLQAYPIKVCWFMLNSHNPIGFTVNDKIKEKIASLLEKYQVYLIEDDTYQELYYFGQKPLPMCYFEHQNRVLHCSSFSKVLGANIRIGWVRTETFSEKIQHLQLMSTLAANTLIQETLANFIATPYYDKHLQKLRKQLYQRKNLLYRLLLRYLPSSCHIHYYSSGYFLWIELPNRLNSTVLFQILLSQNIGITPSHLFSIHEVPHNYIRINSSFHMDSQHKQAIISLAHAIKYLIYQRMPSLLHYFKTDSNAFRRL